MNDRNQEKRDIESIVKNKREIKARKRTRQEDVDRMKRERKYSSKNHYT